MYLKTLSKLLSVLCLSLLWVAAANGQPRPFLDTLYYGTNPNGPLPDQISPNCFFTLKGTALANSTRNWASQDFVNGAMPTQLDGVSVTVNGKPAYISYISPRQINFLTPLDTATGPVTIQVTNNGAPGINTLTMDMEPYAPGLFSWLFNCAGNSCQSWVVATHTDFSDVAPAGTFPGVNSTPASPGETIVLWGTGFGQTDPPLPSGVLPAQTAYTSNPVTVTFTCAGQQSTVPATVALAPGLAGIYQLAVQIPTSIAGDTQIYATVGGIDSPLAVLSMGSKGCGSGGGGGGGKK